MHIAVCNVFNINRKLYGKTSLISKKCYTKLCLHIPLYTLNKLFGYNQSNGVKRSGDLFIEVIHYYCRKVNSV